MSCIGKFWYYVLAMNPFEAVSKHQKVTETKNVNNNMMLKMRFYLQYSKSFHILSIPYTKIPDSYMNIICN